MSNIQAASSSINNAIARQALDRVDVRSNQASPASPEQASQQGVRPSDTLELSQSALEANQPSAKVQSVRSEIAAGTYDSDAKLDAALDRMFESLGI